MKIIQAQKQHLDALVPLFEAYRVWYRRSPDVIKAKAFLSERMDNNESVIYACENKEGALVGFTQLYPIFSSTRMKRVWLLNDLFVSSTFRGQGISKMLIQRAKELAIETNAIAVLLETEKSNSIGNKLYPAMGFELESNNFYAWTNKE